MSLTLRNESPSQRIHGVTLRVVAPVMQCEATVQEQAVRLQWEEPDDVVEGYLVYRSSSPDGQFTRRTPQLENMIAEVERWLQETDGETHD